MAGSKTRMTIERMVLLALPFGCEFTPQALQKALPTLKCPSINQALVLLAASRSVQRVRHGVYRLTNQGKRLQKDLQTEHAAKQAAHGVPA